MQLKRPLLIITVAIICLGYGFYIPAKAILAQLLISNAWSNLSNVTSVKPWAWADMSPVMKLSSKKHGKEFIVLSGDSGESLAFGPGINTQSYRLSSQGTIMISAHRDTHFKFLKNVQIGDIFKLTDKSINKKYQVVSTKVIDSSKTQISLFESGQDLKLITCFPFESIVTGGNMRYVVHAKQI